VNIHRHYRVRALSSAGAGTAALGLLLTLGSAGGASPSNSVRMLAGPQPGLRATTRQAPRGRRPRTAASCAANKSGTNAFDSTWEFSTNKSTSTDFGNSNLAAAGYTGVFEGSGNVICDYNSVIVGGNSDTIDSGTGNVPAGAAYSMIGAGTANVVSNAWAFIGAGNANTVSNSESFIGAGDTDSVSGSDSFVGAGTNNTVSNASSVVGAGDGNNVSNYEAFVGAGTENTVSGFDSFTGAGIGNGVPGTVSFIGAGHNNSVSGHLSFLGAGYGNLVSGSGSFVGAGGDVSAVFPNNQISGNDSFIGAGDENNVASNLAFIGGGQSNRVLGGAGIATIAGGEGNLAAGAYGAIGGGEANAATASFATVPGGYHNVASGVASFAAGYVAEAVTAGSFAWSDESSTTLHVRTTVPNEFVARAAGGVSFFSNPGLTSGVRLAPGAGTWSNLSDRAMKTGVTPLDDAAVLAKVAALPVSEWSYNSERGVRHVGPMAQDFYAAFHVGEDDRHITSIDEDGVALAAIKALRSENMALRAGMRDQHGELVALRSELRRLEATFASNGGAAHNLDAKR